MTAMTHNYPPTCAPSPSWTACCVCQQQQKEEEDEEPTPAACAECYFCAKLCKFDVRFGEPEQCAACALLVVCHVCALRVCVRVCAHHMPSTKQTVGQQQVQGKHNQQLERERKRGNS